MPPAVVAVPVIARPGLIEDTSNGKFGTRYRLQSGSRAYDEGPLPTKPSNYAPKKASILRRTVDDNGVIYDLKIGDVEINDVGLEEIFDYVSPLHLEEFENREFVEERKALEIIIADRERERREKLERQKERAKRKGIVVYEDTDNAETETDVGEVEIGKHGRARPTYTHLFKKLDERKRTNLDSREEDAFSSDNEDTAMAGSARIRPPSPVVDLPKRRRRKRDKVTGELLPLSPIKHRHTTSEQGTKVAKTAKRQRRKRHPLTGELMPIGWSYDPDEHVNAYEMRREGLGIGALSISNEPNAKRQRLDSDPPVSRSPSPLPTKAELAALHSTQQPVAKPSSVNHLKHTDSISISDSDERLPDNPHHRKKNLFRGNAKTKADFREQTALKFASSSEATPEVTEPAPKPFSPATKSPQQSRDARTSIMNPSFDRDSSVEPKGVQSDHEARDDDDLEEDEWFIEAITDHRMSDPKTHPPNLGDQPLMLYLVKWEGFDEPTWEPIESFGDQDMVEEYRRSVGLAPEMVKDDGLRTSPTTTLNHAAEEHEIQPTHVDQVVEAIEEDEEDEEKGDEFEVERIMAHHLSDPRTHPPELGRSPVVLYKVKWVNWDEPTWEPASSFGDHSILQKYHERVSRMST